MAALTVENGKRKVLCGRTRQEVAQKLSAALVARTQGLPIAVERQTLGRFLERWLEDVIEPNRAPKTHHSYAQLVRLHIRPRLGNLPLGKLSAQDVQHFLNEKRAAGLSPRTVQYLRAVLRSALNQAVKWGMVARNVATLVTPPKVSRQEVEPLSPGEATSFLRAVQGHRIEALFTVALALGLRQGEALGLRWEDIDFDRARLHVRKQVQRTRGKLELVDLKTPKSRRMLVLPPFALDALRGHRDRQRFEREAAGTHWEDWGLVFPSDVGTPMDARNLVRRYHKLLRAAGLPRKRFHDLRHTCATLLLIQGEDIRVVMEVLGHSQISLTANTYQHVQEALKRGAADKMEALFASQG